MLYSGTVWRWLSKNKTLSIIIFIYFLTIMYKYGKAFYFLQTCQINEINFFYANQQMCIFYRWQYRSVLPYRRTIFLYLAIQWCFVSVFCYIFTIFNLFLDIFAYWQVLRMPLFLKALIIYNEGRKRVCVISGSVASCTLFLKR